MNVESEKIKSVIDRYRCDKNALIAILQDIQTEFNYLPRPALISVSKLLKVPLIDVIGVATFYSAFSLEPRGDHTVTVCAGTACHVRGGPKILAEFQKKLKIKPGQTTADQKFSLETVACLGCCAIGPVVVVDKDYHAQTNIRKVDSILKMYRQEEENNEEI